MGKVTSHPAGNYTPSMMLADIQEDMVSGEITDVIMIYRTRETGDKTVLSFTNMADDTVLASLHCAIHLYTDKLLYGDAE